MKNRNKPKMTFAALFALVCLFAFSACGSSSDGDDASDGTGMGETTTVADDSDGGVTDGAAVASSGDDEQEFKKAWPDDVPIMGMATDQEYQLNIDPEVTDLVVTADTTEDWESILDFYNGSMPGWEAGDVEQVGPDDDIVRRQVVYTNGDREVTVTLTGDDTRNFQLAYTGPKS